LWRLQRQPLQLGHRGALHSRPGSASPTNLLQGGVHCLLEQTRNSIRRALHLGMNAILRPVRGWLSMPLFLPRLAPLATTVRPSRVQHINLCYFTCSFLAPLRGPPLVPPSPPRPSRFTEYGIPRLRRPNISQISPEHFCPQIVYTRARPPAPKAGCPADQS